MALGLTLDGVGEYAAVTAVDWVDLRTEIVAAAVVGVAEVVVVAPGLELAHKRTVAVE